MREPNKHAWFLQQARFFEHSERSQNIALVFPARHRRNRSSASGEQLEDEERPSTWSQKVCDIVIVQRIPSAGDLV